MRAVNLTRTTIGILIIAGLLFFKPLAYFIGVMMIFSGLTGVCLLERLFNKLGMQGKCNLK